MPWATAALVMGGASILGGMMQGDAAQRAAQTQASAAQNASALQYQMFQQQQAQMQPWVQTGQQALKQMYGLVGPGGQFSQMPTAQDVMQYLAPNYQFQLQQGLGQQQNAMNATGGLVSGNTMQGLNTFAQNFAQNAYQNAFNNLQTGQQNVFNRLASIAGTGQAGTAQTMQTGMGAATNIGNMQTSGAAAQAAGQIGQANAYTQGLTGIGNAYFMNQLMRNPYAANAQNFGSGAGMGIGVGAGGY